MKKTIFFALLTVFSLSAATSFAAKGTTNNTAATETTLTTAEVNVLKSRVEEIRDMDKSDLTANEKSELKSELKEIKETMKSQPYVYIGGGTLILILILLIILL